ncbi:hypothetical protein ILUMI_16409 [Ignelater luminosus]|uniref:Uncharacterized protein n=1 Tax=Ignelater luminosus TaxID=2038154 RepID=A0A8K0CLT5_IGNLU|nr:hypothetical protein ILUMI_16409 [Ignelater luminosus]
MNKDIYPTYDGNLRFNSYSSSCSSSKDFPELTEYFEDSCDSYRDPDYAPSDNENENILPGLTCVSDDSKVEEAENIQLIGSDNNSNNKPVDWEPQKLLETERQKLRRNQKRQQNLTDNGERKLSRKQKRQQEMWKMNVVNKVLCQSGKEHQDVKGNIRRRRNLKTLKNCESNCRFLSAKKLVYMREKLYIKDFGHCQTMPNHIITPEIRRGLTKKRKQTLNEESRRQYSYKYYFHPKKDRCDVCEEYRLKEKTGMGDDERNVRQKHVQGKISAKLNRDLERQNDDEQTAIICFDLENVFALPRSNISCFFYSRKLNIYNLTAHCSLQKQAYCCIWSEATQGRKGNHIASALIRILDHVIDDFPHIKTIILWSDSCVSQNKNSTMSLALMKFLERHPTIEEIEQKFGKPGRSNIQEVDNLHSQIEKKLSKLKMFSPLGLLCQLSTVDQRKSFKIF